MNNNHTVVGCKKENLKAVIHQPTHEARAEGTCPFRRARRMKTVGQHAKAIVVQSKHISTITTKAETLETEVTPEVKLEPKTTKLKTAA